MLLPSIWIIVAGFTCGTAANPAGQDTKTNPVSADLPPGVSKIIANSCLDCHSSGGSKMAISHVNFSEWDNYPAEKKAVKAADMAKIINSGKMPPKRYKESHPEKVLTPTDVETIAKWAGSLTKK